MEIKMNPSFSLYQRHSNRYESYRLESEDFVLITEWENLFEKSAKLIKRR